MRITAAIILMSALSTISSARTIIKSRQQGSITAYGGGDKTAGRRPFELDVTTDALGLLDYYSREDGFIYAKISDNNNIAKAAVRSVNNDVVCTIKDIRGYPIRSFGGVGAVQEYTRQAWENDHAASIGCFYPGDSEATFADKIAAAGQATATNTATIPEAVIVPRQETGHQQPFEIALAYAYGKVQTYHSSEDGSIKTSVLPGDRLINASVSSARGDVVCTIRDENGWQVRKFGGEHPRQINLGDYEALKARTVTCYYPGLEPVGA